MTIGRSWIAVCTVAVPDAVTTTSDALRTSSVRPATLGDPAAANAPERREQFVGQVRCARDDELNAGHPRRDERHGGRERGQVARSSFGRLPGSSATVGAEPSRPHSAAHASRPAGTGVRSSSGWPTNSTGMPASR